MTTTRLGDASENVHPVCLLEWGAGLQYAVMLSCRIIEKLSFYLTWAMCDILFVDLATTQHPQSAAK